MAETTTKRHPIRGFLYGIVFGLGLVFLAVGQGWAALGTWPPVILLIIGLVVGTLWGAYAPAKKPKGDPPPERVLVTAGEPTRFDHVGADDDYAADPTDVPDRTSEDGADSGDADGGSDD